MKKNSKLYFSFEDFLSERCPPERQTNNDPKGEEAWIEQLDVAELIQLADEYGKIRYEQGDIDAINEIYEGSKEGRAEKINEINY